MTQLAKAPLGRLVRVNLRDAWEHEALQFTPWLAQTENISLLGDAIHLDLEGADRPRRQLARAVQTSCARTRSPDTTCSSRTSSNARIIHTWASFSRTPPGWTP